MRFFWPRLDADNVQNSSGKGMRETEMLLKTPRTSLRTLLRTYKYDAYGLPGIRRFKAYRHDTLLNVLLLIITMQFQAEM